MLSGSWKRATSTQPNKFSAKRSMLTPPRSVHFSTTKGKDHHMATAQPLNELPVLQAEMPPQRPFDLLTLALENNAAIDVIERIVALQREERHYHANVAFDEALNRCQQKLERISADASNPQTDSRYASYAKLDKVVRPIYTAEGFALSFGEKDCPTPGKTRFVAYLSRSGVTREYLKDLSPSTKGPKGNDVMTPIHADASADSYAKRYLLKDIFNIAIGEDDNDGNGPSAGLPDDRVREMLGEISRASNLDQLWKVYKFAYREAEAANDRAAIDAYIRAKDARKRGLKQ
jgi:hypothetical protein